MGRTSDGASLASEGPAPHWSLRELWKRSWASTKTMRGTCPALPKAGNRDTPGCLCGNWQYVPARGLFGLKMLYFFQTQADLEVRVNEFAQCHYPAGKSYRGIFSFKQYVYLAFHIWASRLYAPRAYFQNTKSETSREWINIRISYNPAVQEAGA